MNKSLLSVLIAIYAGLFLYLRPWDVFLRNPAPIDIIFSAGTIATLLGLVAACVMMISKRAHKLAKALFIIFNFTYLVIGISAVLVYWYIWFFGKPTFMDRVKVTWAPFLIGVVMPVALVVYAAVHKEKG